MEHMANNQRSPERGRESKEGASKSAEASKGVADNRMREGAMKVLGQLGVAPQTVSDGPVDGGETVNEQASEQAGEQWSGQGSQAQQGQTGTAQQQGGTTQFIFDEKNLPPVDEVIKRIEAKLRMDIKKLEMKAKKYKGGVFSKPDYQNLSKVIREIREKRILIQRLIGMAADALKKLYVTLFKPAAQPIGK